MPSDYWRKRQESLQKTLLQGADDYTEEIERGYRAAVEETEKQIAMWYQRFADNNGVDLIAAQRLLNGDELKELKWDVKQYIKHAEENGIAADWSKELENASARVHISRLEALKMQIREQIEEMCGGRAEKVRELIGDIYTESLYRNGYEHYMRTGTETTFTRVDKQRLNRILDKPWTADGYNFSERLWGNKRKLIKTVNTELTSAIARGEAPTKTAERIARAMKNDKAAAQRLVVTEGAYFATQGQRDCYKELEVEEFEVVGTLDNITCTECGSMDGKHFKVKDMQEGVTAPPFHPNCRCTTVPYYEDDLSDDFERVARAEDGNNVYVNGKMTYTEWEKKCVANSGESGIIKTSGSAVVKEITQSAIDRVPLVDIPIANVDANKIQELHKSLLKFARDNNESCEVAILVKPDMTNLEPIKGDATSVSFMCQGFFQCNGLLHNHPNNASFSNKDVFQFAENKNLLFMTVVKNNGNVDLIYKSSDFDAAKLAVEYKRLEKKYKSRIKDETILYDKVIEKLLNNNKAGLKYKKG